MDRLPQDWFKQVTLPRERRGLKIQVLVSYRCKIKTPSLPAPPAPRANPFRPFPLKTREMLPPVRAFYAKRRNNAQTKAVEKLQRRRAHAQ